MYVHIAATYINYVEVVEVKLYDNDLLATVVNSDNSNTILL